MPDPTPDPFPPDHRLHGLGLGEPERRMAEFLAYLEHEAQEDPRIRTWAVEVLAASLNVTALVGEPERDKVENIRKLGRGLAGVVFEARQSSPHDVQAAVCEVIRGLLDEVVAQEEPGRLSG